MAHAQIDDSKKYIDSWPEIYASIPQPSGCCSTYDNVTGTTELKLRDPNSTRLSISVLYSPNDPLFHSKTSKDIVPVRALKNFENEISLDYVFFNRGPANSHTNIVFKDLYVLVMSLIIRQVKIEAGKMLLEPVKINEKDLMMFSFSDSKRTFYKSLSSASQILGSIRIRGAPPHH